jgi:hypothetical protein
VTSVYLPVLIAVKILIKLGVVLEERSSIKICLA